MKKKKIFIEFIVSTQMAYSSLTVLHNVSKNLSDNPKQFKSALKNYSYVHSFCSTYVNKNDKLS